MTRSARLIPCWIALAILLVFSPLTRCNFTEWDDPTTLARNPNFNPPTFSGVAQYWRKPHMGLYVPVTYTLWAAIAKVSQGTLSNGVGSELKAGPFHTANILLHIASACLVYFILRKLIVKPWPAALGALLFALHPVQVEPVAWASGLKDLLCGLLSFLAIWQYLHFTENRNRGRLILATLAFLAATLSKPTAVMTPVIAFAIDFFFLNRPLRRAIVVPLIWCLIAIPVAVIAGRVQQIGVIPFVPFSQRPFIAADAFTFYLQKLLWPAHLAVDYSRRPVVVLAGHYWVAALVSLCVFAVLFKLRKNRRLLAAALIFIAPLIPVLGFRPFMMQYTSTVADHYLYLPMFGLALAAAALFTSRSIFVQRGFALLVAILALRSSLQTQFWKDDETLNRHTLAVNPNSFTAHINLAHDLELKGDFQGELGEDAQAVRCNPQFPLARGNYAVMLATLGHVQEASEQCVILRELIRPLPPNGRKVFAPTFAFVGRELLWHHDPAAAVALLREALRLDPNCADAQTDLTTAQAVVE